MLVIFDCDGVLVDSEIISAQVLSECLAEMGIHANQQDVLETYRGKSVADCIAMITQHLLDDGQLLDKDSGHDLSAEEKTDRGAAFWRHVQTQTLVACEKSLEPVKGVVPLLEKLQQLQIPFCVASNGKHEKMAMTLVKTNLLHFVEGRVFSFEDVSRGKPWPDLFLHAAKTMNCLPGNTIVIEDSLTGIQAAIAAGMRPLAYCPPNDKGEENYLLADMRRLNVEYFFSMDDLLPLIMEKYNDRYAC